MTYASWRTQERRERKGIYGNVPPSLLRSFLGVSRNVTITDASAALAVVHGISESKPVPPWREIPRIFTDASAALAVLRGIDTGYFEKVRLGNLRFGVLCWFRQETRHLLRKGFGRAMRALSLQGPTQYQAYRDTERAALAGWHGPRLWRDFVAFHAPQNALRLYIY